MKLKYFLFTIIFIFLSGLIYSADISMDVSIIQTNDRYYLRLENKSGTAFSTAGLIFYFNSITTNIPFQYTVAPYEKKDFEISLNKPDIPGSYDLLAVLNYINNDSVCSTLVCKIIHFDRESVLKPFIWIDAPPVFKEGTFTLFQNNPESLTAIKSFFPEQIQLKKVLTNGKTFSYLVENKNPSMMNTAKIYFLFEKTGIISNSYLHSAGFASANLGMGTFYTVLQQSINFWFIAGPVFLMIILIIAGLGWYLKKNNKNEKIKIRGSILQYSAVVLLFSFLVRFFVYNYPFNAFWDENYHVASAQKYVDGVMFMEPHPPLGKLLIALGEIMLKPNRGIDTSSFLATDYISNFPDCYSFIGVRFIPTLLSMLSVLVFFFILYRISSHLQYSFLFTSLFLFDNAMILHTRAAMLEGSQIFFMLTAVLYFLVLFQKNNCIRFYEYLLLGIFTGLAVSVKLNSGILVLLFALLLLKEYFSVLINLIKKIFQNKEGFFKFLLSSFSDLWKIFYVMVLKAVISTAGIIIVFFIVYYIHFAIGEKVVNGRFYRASEEYKEAIDKKEVSNPLHFFTMLKDNFDYIDNYEKGVPVWDPSKKDENGSPAFGWPFGYKSINYRWQELDGNVIYFYFQGNPLIWWAGLLSIIVSVSLIIGRYIFNLKIKDWKIFNQIIIFSFLYICYMATVLQITRVMYLYHYLIPLIFSMILLFLLFLYIFKDLIEKKDRLLMNIVFLIVIEIVITFLIFSPFTYGIPLSAWDFMKRNWLRVWDLKCIYF